tara:strand:- start:32 stop:313 length:282 start_codon:yes stop_codon:yes gene_type:complete
MYYAQIDNTNKVINVIVADSEIVDDNYIKLQGKRFGGIGWTYHPDKNKCSPPQPFPSWTLDNTCTWQSPVTKPEAEGLYNWNEETQSWDETEA